MGDMVMIYRVWAESISDVYVDIEADSMEDAYKIADEYLDGGDFVEDPLGGEWQLGSAVEMEDEDIEPMFYAKDFLGEDERE